MSTTHDQPNSSANSPRIDKKLLWSDDLCTFIESLDSYLPTIPEAVVKYNLQKGVYSRNQHEIWYRDEF